VIQIIEFGFSVVVPSTVIELNKPHPAFDHPTG
jgi:hypothetical protein